MAKRFYVYRIFNITGLLYIGKGSGSRLKAQMRKFGADGEVIAYFDVEAAAYRYERQMIAKFNPPENKNPGGSGGISDRPENAPSGLTPEGLLHVAPHLARLIRLSKEFPGLLKVIRSYAKTHGVAAVVGAIQPYLKVNGLNILAFDCKP